MRIDIFRDTMLLAFSKKTFAGKLSYLLKGLLFLPFLSRNLMGTKGRDKSALTNSEAGEDIYPLF